MLEQSIYEALRDDPTLSPVFADRIYPYGDKIQRGVLPAISYTRISGQPVVTLDGGSDLQNARYQIDLWALDYITIHGDVLDAVVDAMESRSDFRSVVATPPIDGYEVDLKQHRVTIDFSVWRR